MHIYVDIWINEIKQLKYTIVLYTYFSYNTEKKTFTQINIIKLIPFEYIIEK